MALQQGLLLASLLINTFGFIDDSLSSSFIPYVQVSDVTNGQYKREIVISNNQYIASSKWEVGCPDDHTVTFYDLTNDYQLTISRQSDYHVMCAGSSSAPTCIAAKDQIIIKIPCLSTTQTVSNFAGLSAAGYPEIFEGELTQQDIKQNQDINTVYQALKSSVATFVVSSVKLAAGGDYGTDECVDRFHQWTMYLTKAFQEEMTSTYSEYISDVSCIKEAIDSDPKHLRPSNLADALSKCPKTSKRDSLGANPLKSSSGGGRRLLTSYTSSQVLAWVNDNNLCPFGDSTIDACGNPKFGMCGYQETCWTSICGDCGCNNGCFEHDYSCSCKGFYSVDCWTGYSFFLADKECDSGSVCITVDKMENIGTLNANADNWFGSYYGEPYISIEPNSPDGPERWTDYAGDHYTGNDYTFSSSDNNRLCFSMRFTSFYVRLWDDDGVGDDKLWEVSVSLGNDGQYSVGSGSGSTPKVTYTVDKRGW